MHKNKKVVVNSTPIIALSSIGKICLLKEMYGEIIIPLAVYNEIVAKKDSKAYKVLIDNKDWIRIYRVRNKEAKELFSISLHNGEVEVMISAQEIDADVVIIDDLLARRHAKYLDLSLTGTLGILLKAKRKGLISSVKEEIDRLIKNQIYISKRLYDKILNLAGEK